MNNEIKFEVKPHPIKGRLELVLEISKESEILENIVKYDEYDPNVSNLCIRIDIQKFISALKILQENPNLFETVEISCSIEPLSPDEDSPIQFSLKRLMIRVMPTSIDPNVHKWFYYMYVNWCNNWKEYSYYELEISWYLNQFLGTQKGRNISELINSLENLIH